MKVSINQPAYLPWLGYFDRIAKSDTHIVLDHVQFEKNSMTNRNKINTNQLPCLLTVPVATSGKFGQLAINEVNIKNQLAWQRKHWNSIYFNYKKSPYFSMYEEQLYSCYHREWGLLGELLRWQLEFFLAALKIDTPIIYSSTLGCQHRKSELIIELCQKQKASSYLSGPFGRDYLDKDAFDINNINLEYHDYIHPEYKQHLTSKGFESHLSVLDLLFNHGGNSATILMT